MGANTTMLEAVMDHPDGPFCDVCGLYADHKPEVHGADFVEAARLRRERGER